MRASNAPVPDRILVLAVEYAAGKPVEWFPTAAESARHEAATE
jgi:hypothetical protein